MIGEERREEKGNVEGKRATRRTRKKKENGGKENENRR